jgi:protein ImuB
MMRRALVLWCPGWSVVSAYGDDSLPEVVPGVPVAIVHKGLVSECSPEALDAGVRVGMRRRDAHLMCPQLVLTAHQEERDRRVFDRVVIDLAQCVPDHSLLSPGLVAFHARGLEHFYGSEEAAARMLREALVASEPLATARIGIADDLFSAVIAAQHATDDYPLHSVEKGASAEFLSDVSVETLHDPSIVSLLLRLGVTTLGGFVALGLEAIRDRLGVNGERLYRLASGTGHTFLEMKQAPVDPVRRIELPEALVSVDQVSFALRVPVEEYVATLRSAGAVCTQVSITLGFDNDTTHQRVWQHPRYFEASDVVDRVRWQLEQCFRDQQGKGSGVPVAVSWVRCEALSPEEVSVHEPGLWGQGPDARVHHVFSRVQSMVGAGGVMTASPRVSRVASETQVLTPWGDSVREQEAPGPLPGALPSPLPGTVFATPIEVIVLAAGEEPVVVSEQAQLSLPPRALVWGSRRLVVVSWAGPWPVWEKWWDPTQSRFLHRVQLIDDHGMGWLVSAQQHNRWFLEARYD